MKILDQIVARNPKWIIDPRDRWGSDVDGVVGGQVAGAGALFSFSLAGQTIMSRVVGAGPLSFRADDVFPDKDEIFSVSDYVEAIIGVVSDLNHRIVSSVHIGSVLMRMSPLVCRSVLVRLNQVFFRENPIGSRLQMEMLNRAMAAGDDRLTEDLQAEIGKSRFRSSDIRSEFDAYLSSEYFPFGSCELELFSKSIAGKSSGDYSESEMRTQLWFMATNANSRL